MQSKTKFFAAFLLVFSLSLGLFLSPLPTSAGEPNNGDCEEECPVEEHNLVLTSMCYDEEAMVRVWRVFHQDESNAYFPIKLGYKIYPGSIVPLDDPFTFSHTKEARFDNPYLFETVYDGNPQTVILYWENEGKEKWIKDDTKAANNEVCEKKYIECSETVFSEGTWSEWTVDSSDSTKEIRQKTNIYTDSKNSEKICQTDILKESRDIKGEVKGTTTVVLAKTGAVERSTVYLIQSLLMLVTGASLIYVGKEYLNRA